MRWLLEKAARGADAMGVSLGVIVFVLHGLRAALEHDGAEPEFRAASPLTLDDDEHACVIEGEGLDVVLNGPGAEA